MSEIKEGVDRIEKRLDKFEDKVDNKLDKVQNTILGIAAKKVAYGVFIGMLTIILAVIGLTSNSFIDRIKYIENKVDYMNTENMEVHKRMNTVERKFSWFKEHVENKN